MPLFIPSSIASAHVTVTPAEVITAGYQTFTVNVPSEKDMATVSVKVAIPSDVTSVTPTKKTGWSTSTESTGETVTAITWSGGTIDARLRDEFTFTAAVPKNATILQWKAYQTYLDGTVVAWDKKQESGSHSDDNSGPLSITNVVAEPPSTVAIRQAEKTAVDARNTANRSMIIGVAGIVVGAIGVFLATRQSSR